MLRCPVFRLLLQFLLSPVLLAADPPKIERLYPPGGQRGTTVECKLTGSAGDEAPQVWSSEGRLSFEFSEKRDTVKVTIPEDTIPGVHWLRFFNQHGATDLRPFVVGIIPEVNDEEPNNQLSESEQRKTIQQLPVTINGVLEKSEDVDMFAVQLTAGQTLIASVDANERLGSPMDSVLQLLDRRGAIVAQNDDDHGSDSQIVHTATSDGEYHIRLFAFPATPNSSIKMSASANHVYRLTVTTGPFVDYVVPAVINPTESDDVRVVGWNIAEPGATVTLRSPKELIAFAEKVALAKSVDIVSHVSLVEAPGQPQQLAVPSSLTGVISADAEEDVFTFSAKQKQTLTVTTAARSIQSQLDPVVTVTSEDGKVIKESDDRSKTDLDAEASFTIPSDGIYRVKVADRYGSGGERHFYALTLTETVPDFSATLSANHFGLTNDGKPLEIPVMIKRSSGFTDTIEFTIQGLPQGVKCAPVLSEEKGDSKKGVTLKLTREEFTDAFSGNIQITGTSQTSQQSRSVESPIQNSNQLTADIWLTVIAPKPEPKTDAKAEPASP